MTEPQYPQFRNEYRRLLWSLLSDDWSVAEMNQRTGHEVRSMRFGATLYVDMTRGLLPVIDVRKTFPRSAAAETAWYALGTQDPEFIFRYARRMWEKFTDPANVLDDGGPKQIVSSAYGYRWRRAFGRDQLQLAIDALRKDSSNRRVWVSAWDPGQDGLGAEGQKNVPCPVGFSLSIVGGKLNSTLVLRSSDVFVGLPYDVMGHAMLMSMVRSELDELDPAYGVMTVTLAHPHIYDSHYEMAAEALRQTPSAPEIPMIEASLADVVRDPDGYVAAWKLAQSQAEWPAYCPVPEVIE